MYGAIREEDPLTGGRNPSQRVELVFNIEELRFWGILAFVPLILIGKFMTQT